MMGTFWRGCGLAFFVSGAGQQRRGSQAALQFYVSNDEKTSIRVLWLLTEVPLFSNLLPRSSHLNAGVAQLVEQRIRNAKVAGSTPVSGTTLTVICVWSIWIVSFWISPCSHHPSL